MNGFFAELKEQRWDDHRYYHNSRINQTLHLISAMSFVATYALLFVHPVFAVLFGWTFSMCSRQIGHFFFEPKGYDERNQATHEYKESVKVGYNLRRKVILHSIWGAVPVVLFFAPTLFGIFKQPWTDASGYADHLARVWLVLAGGALVFRTVQLFFFEPKGYDEKNQATHEYKESVKVGYNLKRKVILHSIWGAVPVILFFSPTMLGIFKQPWTNASGYADHLAHLWLVLAGGALVFRTVHLFFIRSVKTGLAWFTKILTDPFHDIYLYHKAPMYLLRGELIAPAHHGA